MPEAIFADDRGRKERVKLAQGYCEVADLALFAEMFEAEENEGQAISKRIGIAGTLHRISLITKAHPPPAKVIGIAARIGRVVGGVVKRTGPTVLDLIISKHRSLLIVGKPGVGKTTVLREFAKLLSERSDLNVVVVDKTNEIAGDGIKPHPAIGDARWLPVGNPKMQASIMREAVENQSPDVIIVDEISTPEEVEAARTISQRGVVLIASIHASTLPELVNCKERGYLVGGQHTITLTDAAASQRSDKRKSVSKRSNPSRSRFLALT